MLDEPPPKCICFSTFVMADGHWQYREKFDFCVFFRLPKSFVLTQHILANLLHFILFKIEFEMDYP